MDLDKPFEWAPYPMLILDSELTILACNRAYEDAVCIDRQSMVGRPVFDVFKASDPTGMQQLQASFAHVLKSGLPHHIHRLEYDIAGHAKHQARHWSIKNIPLANDEGAIVGILNCPTDITELERLRQIHRVRGATRIATAAEQDERLRAADLTSMLHSEMNRLRQLFQQAPGFICVLRGPSHIFELANDAYYQLVGHREIVGKGLSQVLPEVIAQGFLEILDRVYSTSTPFVGRAMPILLQRVPEGDLEQRYIDLIYQPMLDDEENVTGIFVQGNDVTEAFILAQEVAHQAAHDFLTGLPNRREFARRILELSGPGPHAFLYLDIDHFKLINDRCGHAAGDSLLLQVADLLRSHCVSSSDILARLGGDEFAIVRQNCAPGAATEFGNRLRVAIKELRLVWEGKHYGVTLSVGIASFGGATGLSFETALSLADAASFIAKEAGRNRVQVSLPSDEDIRRQQTDLDSIARLTEAMLQDRVVLHVQRIVDLHDDSGLDRSIFEVLARIRDPMGGILGPAGFIPAAERFGLIEDLDRHIITKVFSHIQAQPTIAALNRTYFINISGITLSASGFPCFIREALLAYPHVCAAGICFEITETAALSHMERTVEAMLSLTSLGFKFALDDFGSGMASFGYLHKLPVQYIKIDGEFIRTVFDQRVSLIIVEAITKVAHAMNMKVIAESVERPEMISHLKALGVNFGQGFALHRPENM